MREIITHHTDVLFPHAEDAEGAKILLYNAIAGGIAGYARRENAEVVGNQWLYSIFVSHPASAFSRRSETCDLSSVSVKSRGIKTPRSLRSLREIITTRRMFCLRTQRAQRAQRFYYITLSLEGSLATRDVRTQRLSETSGCIVYLFPILPLRSPVVVKLATSPASA